MANEPLDAAGSIPENLADDVPTDVDFTALMARSQAQIIAQTGRYTQSNQDLREKLAIIRGTESQS